MPFFSPFGGDSPPGGSGGGGISASNFSAASAGVSDIFAGFGDLEKAKGAEIEAGAYRQAAVYAGQEAQVSEANTRIQEVRANRELYTAASRAAGIPATWRLSAELWFGLRHSAWGRVARQGGGSGYVGLNPPADCLNWAATSPNHSAELYIDATSAVLRNHPNPLFLFRRPQLPGRFRSHRAI